MIAEARITTCTGVVLRFRQGGIRLHNGSFKRPKAPSLHVSPCSLPTTTPRRSRASLHNIRATIVTYSADDLEQDGTGKSRTYKGLSIALGIIGIASLASPQKVIELTYAASPTAIIVGFTRLLGSVHLLAAIASNCLSDAAAHARLSSDTYKRLNLGVSAWGAAALAAFLTAPVLPTTPAKYAYGAILAAAALVPATLANGLWAPLPPTPRLMPIFTAQRLYSLAGTATAVLAATIAYTCISPGSVSVSWMAFPIGGLGTGLLRMLGAGGVLAAFVLTALEDAARRGRLGGGTFKDLNKGIALVCASVLVIAEAGWKYGMVRQKWPALPQTIAEFTVRWPDVFSEYCLVVAGVLGVVAAVQAVIAKK